MVSDAVSERWLVAAGLMLLAPLLSSPSLAAYECRSRWSCRVGARLDHLFGQLWSFCAGLTLSVPWKGLGLVYSDCYYGSMLAELGQLCLRVGNESSPDCRLLG